MNAGDNTVFWHPKIYKEDVPQKVCEFMNDQFPNGLHGQPWTREYFNWKINGNNGILVSAESQNGEVLGITTVNYKEISYKGEMIKVGEVGDAYTHTKLRKYMKKTPHNEDDQLSSYQKKSAFGALVYYLEKYSRQDKVEILIGMPNSNALPAWKKLGYCEGLEFGVSKEFNFTYILQNYKRHRNFDCLNIFDNSNLVIAKLVQHKNQLKDFSYITRRFVNSPSTKFHFVFVVRDDVLIDLIIYKLQRTKFFIKKCIICYKLKNDNELFETKDLISNVLIEKWIYKSKANLRLPIIYKNFNMNIDFSKVNLEAFHFDAH